MSLQQYWIELDAQLQQVSQSGTNTEMQEKRTVEQYLKELGSKSRSSVLQERTPDGLSVRIYTWMDTPIGNVALVSGRDVEPSLHYLIAEDENVDGEEIDLIIKGRGGRPNMVSVPIPHTPQRPSRKPVHHPKHHHRPHQRHRQPQTRRTVTKTVRHTEYYPQPLDCLLYTSPSPRD